MEWGGLGHARVGWGRVGWGGSCKGGVGHVGVSLCQKKMFFNYYKGKFLKP